MGEFSVPFSRSGDRQEMRTGASDWTIAMSPARLIPCVEKSENMKSNKVRAVTSAGDCPPISAQPCKMRTQPNRAFSDRSLNCAALPPPTRLALALLAPNQSLQKQFSGFWLYIHINIKFFCAGQMHVPSFFFFGTAFAIGGYCR